MEKIKKLFQSTPSVNGSYSIGLIALAICIAVVINMIMGQMPENIRNIDISDKKIYEVSDVSKKVLNKLDKKITFTVFAKKDSTDERIKTFIRKYTALSDNIEVKWVDPVLHPSELSKNNVEENNILISCKDTGKNTVVTFDEILVIDEYSYYMTGNSEATQFDGEGQFTSAVNYVTSEEAKKIYYTTGHGEKTFSSSVSELLEKNNMTESEVNLIMNNEIPEDCDLLFMYAPTSDITEDEKTEILSYMSKGGKAFIILGDTQDETPNLDGLLKEYGMERTDGYIADMQRCYQGNYYYIFPEITASDELAEGLSSDMVLLVDAHGLNLRDDVKDTVSVTDFMATSPDAYAVTEEEQKQGTYTLGAVAVESIASDTENSGEELQSRLTVIASDSLIDSQITESFATLENLELFMNAVSANFNDMENVAIEPKSLEVTYNTMQHAGLISILVIFGIPAVILIFGFTRWWKRRKA